MGVTSFKARGVRFFYKSFFEPLKRHEITRIYRTEEQIHYGGTFEKGQILTMEYPKKSATYVENGKVKTKSDVVFVGRVRVTDVVAVEKEKITEDDAKKAGYSSLRDFLRVEGFPMRDIVIQIDFEWLDEKQCPENNC